MELLDWEGGINMKLHGLQIVILALKQSDNSFCNGWKRNTRVCLFFETSIHSILNVMGSTLKSCCFGRLKGEEDWSCLLVDSVVCWPRLGVLTSSVFRVSDPQWLIVWTSFNLSKVPFGITFFGLEENDILARGKVWQHLGIEGWINPHMEKKPWQNLNQNVD